MTCTGRWAEAIDFATTFCVEALLSGLDEGVGLAHASITTSVWSWVQQGMQVGSPVLNVTSGVYGKVTNVSSNILLVSGVTFDNGDSYIVLPLSANEVATIEHFLNISAGAINVAIQAAGACDCTMTAASLEFLKDLNAMIAAVRHNCSCGNAGLDTNMRVAMMQRVQDDLALIRTGEIELCEGYAGKNYPAWGDVERAFTPDGEAEIVYNRRRRNG